MTVHRSVAPRATSRWALFWFRGSASRARLTWPFCFSFVAGHAGAAQRFAQGADQMQRRIWQRSARDPAVGARALSQAGENCCSLLPCLYPLAILIAAFCPHLTVGPVMRARELRSQLSDLARPSAGFQGEGLPIAEGRRGVLRFSNAAGAITSDHMCPANLVLLLLRFVRR